MFKIFVQLSYVLITALFFSQIAIATQTNDEPDVQSNLEYFVPTPLEPTLSSDGKALYNAGPTIVYVADPNPPQRLRRIPAPAHLLAPPDSAAATFSITYVPEGNTDNWGELCYTFPNEAKTVFNAAANIWANILQSSVPITIRACWANLSGGTLGYAGDQPLRRDFTNAPLSNTWYVGALANSLYGSDLDSSSFDMHITYNMNFTWYYGTDGSTPAGQYDLLSVVLHEMAHGLGFTGSMRYSEGQGSWGYSGYPNIYDTFMRDGFGNQLINTSVYPNPSTTLGTALTSSNIWFHGSNAMAANSGQRVKMYAPSTWAPGSSYSHLDYTTFNETANELMVYAISAGESIHDPGPITRGLFKDLGWQISSPACTYTILPTSQSFSASGGTGSVNVTTQAGCAWTATESLDWVAITLGSSGTGNGTVNYSVAANTGAARTGNMTIAGKTFIITQSGVVIGGNLLLNPGFESGAAMWTQYSSAGYQIITQDASHAHSGSWYAWLGGDYDHEDYIYQDVSIPADAAQAYVQFWYRISTEETTSTTPYDIMYVQIRRPSDNALLVTLATLSNLNKTIGYVQSAQYDVSSFKGQTIRLIFSSITNSSLNTNFRIDDVALVVTQAGTTVIYKGDFNGDGRTDILTRDPSTGNAVMRQSNVSGGNWAGWSNVWAAWPASHSEVYVGDFNGDARADILTRDPSTGNAVIRLSNVSGVNWAGWSNVWAAWPASYSKVYVGDFNGDGKADILTVNPATGAAILRQSAGGAGTWTSWTNYWAPLPVSHSEVYVGNFNGDGRADILTRDPATGNAVVRLSLLSGVNWAGWSNVWAAWPVSYSKVYVGDFNGDGKADILTVNPATGAAILRQSAGGAGTWTSWTNYWAPLPVSHSEVYVGNFNGGVINDILTRDPSTGGAVVRQAVVSGVNWAGWSNVWAAWPLSYSKVYAGDYNGGGVSDILTVNPSGGAVLRQSIVSGGNWAGWQNYWAGW